MRAAVQFTQIRFLNVRIVSYASKTVLLEFSHRGLETLIGHPKCPILDNVHIWIHMLLHISIQTMSEVLKTGTFILTSVNSPSCKVVVT